MEKFYGNKPLLRNIFRLMHWIEPEDLGKYWGLARDDSMGFYGKATSIEDQEFWFGVAMILGRDKDELVHEVACFICSWYDLAIKGDKPRDIYPEDIIEHAREANGDNYWLVEEVFKKCPDFY